MKGEADKIVRECEACHRHSPLIHISTVDMIAISSPCPFARWGMDIVGPFVKTKWSKQWKLCRKLVKER